MAQNFILWGFSLFVIVLTEKLLLKKLTDRYALAGHLYMAVLIPLSWMLFGISDPGSIEVYTRKLFPFFSADDAIIYVNDFWKNSVYCIYVGSNDPFLYFRF